MPLLNLSSIYSSVLVSNGTSCKACFSKYFTENAVLQMNKGGILTLSLFLSSSCPCFSSFCLDTTSPLALILFLLFQWGWLKCRNHQNVQLSPIQSQNVSSMCSLTSSKTPCSATSAVCGSKPPPPSCSFFSLPSFTCYPSSDFWCGCFLLWSAASQDCASLLTFFLMLNANS